MTASSPPAQKGKELLVRALSHSSSPSRPMPTKIIPRKQYARALFSCAKVEDDELEFPQAAIIEVVDKTGEWWWGKVIKPAGKRGDVVGAFPPQYVKLLPDDFDPTTDLNGTTIIVTDARRFFDSLINIIATELDFVIRLHSIRKSFVIPLRGVSRAEADSLLPQWDALIMLHDTFLRDLAETLLSKEELTAVVRPYVDGSSPVMSSVTPPTQPLSTATQLPDMTCIENDASRTFLSRLHTRIMALQTAFHALEIRLGKIHVIDPTRAKLELERLLCECVVDQSRALSEFARVLPLERTYFKFVDATMGSLCDEHNKNKHLAKLERECGFKATDVFMLPVSRVTQYSELIVELMNAVPASRQLTRDVVQALHAKFAVMKQVLIEAQQVETNEAKGWTYYAPLVRPQSSLDSLGLSHHNGNGIDHVRFVMDGSLVVRGVKSPPKAAMEIVRWAQRINDELLKKSPSSLRGLLFSNQLILLEKYSNMVGQVRFSVLQSIRFGDLGDTWKEVDVDVEGRDGFRIELTSRDGSLIEWHFLGAPGRQDDWVNWLHELLAVIRRGKKPTTEVAVTPRSPLEHLRTPLTAFYSLVNSDKVKNVDGVLAGFAGSGEDIDPVEAENKLNAALMEAYGCDLNSPASVLTLYY